jgi:drug/metabolite transporter (DMT)-like permease
MQVADVAGPARAWLHAAGAMDRRGLVASMRALFPTMSRTVASLPLSQRLWSNAYLLLTLTALFWAGNAISSRMAVGEVSPMLLTCLRWLGVCIGLLPFYGRDAAGAFPVLMRHPARTLLMATLGFTGFNVLMYIAGQYTTATNIGLLQGAMPAMIFLGAFLIYRATMTPVEAFGLIVTTLGVIVIATGGSLETIRSLSFNRGDVMMLVACSFYAGYTVMVRNRPAMPGIVFFVAMAVIAFLASLPAVAVEYELGGLIWPTTKGWLILAYVTAFPSLLAQIFFIRGVELVGPGRSGLFVNLTPAFTAVLAVLLLREPFGPVQGLAMAMIIGGIALAERKPAAA